MLGKYLKDLGIQEDKTPQGWCPNDDRQKFWDKDRETYGFDSRETWSLHLNSGYMRDYLCIMK